MNNYLKRHCKIIVCNRRTLKAFDFVGVQLLNPPPLSLPLSQISNLNFVHALVENHAKNIITTFVSFHCGSFDHPDMQSLNNYKFLVCFVIGIFKLGQLQIFQHM